MQLITPDFDLILWSIISILYLSAMLMALISILRSDFRDSTTKLIWILVVMFMPIIGSILYVTIGREQRIKQ
jgi:CDP-diglyceride synthetase